MEESRAAILPWPVPRSRQDRKVPEACGDATPCALAGAYLHTRSHTQLHSSCTWLCPNRVCGFEDIRCTFLVNDRSDTPLHSRHAMACHHTIQPDEDVHLNRSSTQSEDLAVQSCCTACVRRLYTCQASITHRYADIYTYQLTKQCAYLANHYMLVVVYLPAGQ